VKNEHTRQNETKNKNNNEVMKCFLMCYWNNPSWWHPNSNKCD